VTNGPSSRARSARSVRSPDAEAFTPVGFPAYFRQGEDVFRLREVEMDT
jgi:hypothetical protein